MGSISKETLKKLTLLYFISRFNNDGAYTSYRVQKVLYFALKDQKQHPFLFMHTQKGQYSKDVREDLDSLVSLGLIDRSGLPERGEAGAKWKVFINTDTFPFIENYPKIAPELAKSISESVNKIGYLKSDELVKLAHEDELLNATEFGKVLFEENLPKHIKVDLSEDQCDDLDLALNDRFIDCVDHLVDAINSTKFDLGEVKVAESFL